MNSYNRIWLGIISCLVVPAGFADSQLFISSLTEVQRGCVPDEDAEAFSNVYEQLNVDYNTGDFQASGRFEIYRASVDGRSMTFLSQRSASWRKGSVFVVGGNFQGILGRGVTMRAFELPGVLLESTLFRQRYTNTQDMEGGLASWSDDRIEIKALAGRPVAGGVPPGYPDTISVFDKLTGLGSDRRRDWVLGSEVGVRPVPALKVGVTAVNLRPDGQEDSYAWSWLAGLDLGPVFERAGTSLLYGELYAELAKREQFSSEGHGRYFSGTLGIGPVGLSVEYKDYDNFDLPANDPPQLVREHTAYLLNRKTHLLQKLNETGFQVETVFPLSGFATFTGNISRGKNRLSSKVYTIFDERFIGMDLHFPSEAHSISLFFDWGQDEIEALATHRTGGFVLGTTTEQKHSFEWTLELQRGKLSFGVDPWYWDTYSALSWQSPIGFGAALVIDRSTDPSEMDLAETSEVESDPARFISLNLTGRFGPYEALLFAGERRGGTACSSGTCYEVLAFRGLELRVLTRF
ncbi:MAG: hypothetical protein VX910_02995 [Candidatus Latescibacterota bacterium]|nr:hypothetical protein [Candidatus Latescibacterota bacterium]